MVNHYIIPGHLGDDFKIGIVAKVDETSFLFKASTNSTYKCKPLIMTCA